MPFPKDVLSTKIDVIFVMGVSGCGKTTTGRQLAESLEWRYKDGDDFHSDANLTKMKSGLPLNDADRMPWLAAINAYCRANNKIVVGCSALKRSYRSVLRTGIRCRFVFLNVDRKLLEKRVKGRKNHFMPPELLNSQLATLEDPSEEDDVVAIQIHDEECPSVLTEYIMQRLLHNAQ